MKSIIPFIKQNNEPIYQSNKSGETMNSIPYKYIKSSTQTIQIANQPLNPRINQSSTQPTNQSTNQPINRPTQSFK